MRDAAPQTIYLKDYTPFGYTVDKVHLTFDLAPNATRVTSLIRFTPVEDVKDTTFFLHGENLMLRSAKIDGEVVKPKVTPEGLTCEVPNIPFIWECEVQIDPAANTTLEGLYQSSGMYCTQCEAEGFRKITYYPDRPDVMSTFTVRINGPHSTLLCNGNTVASGDGWAEWHDPWPKPAYLFALVAGELIAHPGEFTTMNGRSVDLNLYVRPGDEGKCAFGMQALKDSMKWDEEVYGREYDLEIFNIVAVDDFNMGAMENKGLNIFNTAVVLAKPESATDSDYERVQGVVGHEYFHNWSGNRVTVRDWLQPVTPRIPTCTPRTPAARTPIQPGARLVPALSQGRPDQLPPARLRGRHDLRRRAPHRGGARDPRRPVPPGRRPDGALGPTRVILGHRQLLHGDRLQQGRRGDPHAPHPDRARGLRPGHGSLFRAS